jgi:hypothetical protein
MRLTLPSTAPELLGMVSPAVTVAQSFAEYFPELSRVAR